MAGGLFDDEQKEITDINVTPLVDVMLVLLIIFMVTATYIVNQSINVNLPKAKTGRDVAAKNLSFVLDKESKLYLNGNQITYDEVEAKIKIELAKDAPGPLQALIAADRDTPHGAVIKLIDTVRKNGITDFAINVQAEDLR